MRRVDPSAIISGLKYTFEFTFTLRNETVDINSYECNYIIDIDGSIYEKNPTSSDIKIKIVGGIDTFINEKETRATLNFFLTDGQKIVLYRIIREISKKTDSAIIEANQEKLMTFLQSLYTNYCG